MIGRVVCADSYFASVFAAEHMKSIGLRCIGIVKTATRPFPLKMRSAIELGNGGGRQALVCVDENSFPKLSAFLRMDWNRKYPITNCTTLAPGWPYSGVRWQQVEDVNPSADPERL